MEKNILKRVASLTLAMVMTLSVLVVVKPQEVSAANYILKTIKNASGKQTVTITDDECYGGTYDTYDNDGNRNEVSYGTGKICYIKFKAKADGYVKFSVAFSTSIKGYSESGRERGIKGTWALYKSPNPNKQISRLNAFNTNIFSNSYRGGADQTLYGIKKNKTYYLGVKADAGIKITAKFTTVKENSGTKKSKAKTIKQGKTIKGTIVANSKETDWYKFTLSTDQNIAIDFTGKSDNDLKITLYKGSKKATSITMQPSGGIRYPGWYTNASKGTYYIKIEGIKNSKGYYGSGYYTFKLKTIYKAPGF